MKAEDVMKALELCIASRPKCKDCPYFIGGIRCKHSKLLRDALALLREKDAEIERLREMYINDGFDIVDHAVDKIREERKKAVRKMSERLKAETITIQDHTGKLGSVVLVSTIDQIAKEMVEGK